MPFAQTAEPAAELERPCFFMPPRVNGSLAQLSTTFEVCISEIVEYLYSPALKWWSPFSNGCGSRRMEEGVAREAQRLCSMALGPVRVVQLSEQSSTRERVAPWLDLLSAADSGSLR